MIFIQTYRSVPRSFAQMSMLCLTIGAITGCSGALAPSSSSAVGLSGQLSTSSGASALFQVNHSHALSNRSSSLADDSVVCATLTTPPITATASVHSDGSFTISIPGGTNQPMNCNLVDASGDLLASIVTSDSSHKNMQGNPTTADTLAFSTTADLGSIDYDPNTGEATVPVTNISSSLVTQSFSPSAAFDPTGNWVIGNVDFTLPQGYVGPCPNGGGQGCNGPPLGQDIFLKRWNGVSTADESTPVYGLQIWNSQASATACGNKIGLTSAEATALGIDFSSNGSALASFTFATSVTINGTPQAITNGYELSGAVTQWQTTKNCGSKNITVGGNSYSAYVCGADSQGYYNVNLGGGCVDGNGKPVNTQGSWNTTGECTQTDEGGGYTQMSCPGTANGTAVTCTNIGGTFTDDTLTTPLNSQTGILTTTGDLNGTTTVSNLASTAGLIAGMVISGNGDIPGGMTSTVIVSVNAGAHSITMSQAATGTQTGSPITFGQFFNQNFYTTNTVAQGTDCSVLTDPLGLEQCYAQYYQNNAGNGNSSACTPRVNTDWSTTDPTKFATVSWSPNSLPLMNQLVYLSATSAASRNEQDQIQGVQSSQGNGQMVNCHVHEVDSISFTEVDSTHILAQYTASDSTSDVGLPDCVAQYGDTKTKFMFTLTKH